MKNYRKNIHNKYYSCVRVQKSVISSRNFTYRNIIDVLDRYLRRGDKVLDIGCGVGTLDFYMASKGLSVVGLDLSETAIEGAKRNSRQLKLEKATKFYVSDFPREKVKGKFDLVVATEVLEHIPDDHGSMKMINSYLKDGGLVFISVPLANAPLFKLGLLKNFDIRVGHLRRYKEKEILDLIEKEGFKIVYVQKFEGIIRNSLFTNKILGMLIRFFRGCLSDFINFFDSISLLIFGASQIVMVAKK